ncbi:Do family serine endopeptidase [Kozakia baliensis]|uniref:Probable periplasmic serine endoprotease DegP-like n=1 Tax=Kozakia baliensis TaxID=153496 RepID=A0A1D8UQ63_9PROT|nr:Do family serine endopeptidase [Kozakia baliensis]AOX15781.1 endopeptidase [Kozakia baliensis]
MTDSFRPRLTPSPFRRSLVLAAASVLALGVGVTSPALAEGPIQPQTQLHTLPNFVNLVKQVKPAVVSITSRIRSDVAEQEEGGEPQQQMPHGMPFPFPFPFQMMPQQQQRRTIEARGSGFIISADGYVVTNNHVVNGATKVTITLDDGTTLPAKIIGRDPKTDVALLKIKPNGKLPFIELGDSDNVQPGEWVVAVGNPFGLGGTVTAGIVSARGRNLGAGPYDDFLQIDAPINHGNSGGPLFSQDGKVIGVNAAIISPSGGSIGIGFAIPSNTVKSVVDQLRKTGHVTRGYLGINTQMISPTMAQALGLKPSEPGAPPEGALVASVESGSPADKAGIKSGDVITTLNGNKLHDMHDLVVHVVSMVPGSSASLGLLRNGKPMNFDVKIGNAPKDGGSSDASGSDSNDQAGSGRIGVSLAPLSRDMRQQLGVDENVHGAVVSEVQQGSAADQAGIRPGDIIQSVGNTAVENPRAVMNAVQTVLKAKQPVLFRIQRDGQQLFIAVAPGASSDNDDNSGDDAN